MKKIVFCLPGNSYKRAFFDSWIKLENYLNINKIDYVVSTAGGSNISKVRERCVRPFRSGSNHPKEPFFGDIDYSYLMWIDSDIVFTPEHFQTLLDHKENIVSGLYKNAKGDFVCQIDDRITAEEQAGKLIEVFWAGMGFMLIKRGVLENINPPWFQTAPIDTHDRKDVFAGEDIFFCYRAREAGYKVFVEPKVVVGHIKEQQI